MSDKPQADLMSKIMDAVSLIIIATIAITVAAALVKPYLGVILFMVGLGVFISFVVRKTRYWN